MTPPKAEHVEVDPPSEPEPQIGSLFSDVFQTISIAPRFIAGEQDKIWFTRTELEVFIALREAGTNGVTIPELAELVTRWRNGNPSPEAVQKIVSKISIKLEDAGKPYRGRTENVNPSEGPIPDPSQSKKRRRGRPRKSGDGQFRAYLYSVTP